MNTTGGATMESADDPRLLSALREYTDAFEAGRPLNRTQLLSRHPEIARELSACLGGLALVNAATAEVVEATPDAQPLGDFRLVRQIGRGGMGVVYEAVQLSLGRQVAVKILPLAAALDQRQLQRFKNEAAAAAQLHHSNIVPVYAVGCERGVHFYAMQLIDGQSLAEVIADLRRQVSGVSTLTSLRGKRREYFREVARLALQAADALDYAHRLGIVHRDIKPGNLMLDKLGHLWITDFGLAQFYGDTSLTCSGDLIGTLCYMSPEQASGRAAVLDQRTDIYSLGMTIYELLTLCKALSGQTREELLHQISAVTPRPPRSVDKSVPIELQTILDRATAKEAAERYPTARALADDLQRFLKDEPIRARPASPWNKAVKWTRRHRSLALSAIVTLFIAAICLAISTVMIAQKAAEANQERQWALRNFEQARRAVNSLTAAADELPRQPQLADARRHLLEVALGYYQTFIAQSRGDKSIEAQLTAAQTRVMSILAELATSDERDRFIFKIHLLDDPAARDDLKLDRSQYDLLQPLAEKFLPGPFGPPRRGAELPSQLQEAQATVSAVLTAAQSERLDQISRQLRGVLALNDPDVQAALKLTIDQQESIRKIHSDAGPEHGGAMRGPPPGGPGPGIFRIGMAPRENEEVLARTLGQLSPGQRQAWQNLVGRPFVGDAASFPGPGPGMDFD